MENQFQLGVHLGTMNGRITVLERAMKTLKGEIQEFKTWLIRGAILAGLWIIAVLSNLSTDTLAQLVIAVIRGWTGH